VANDYEGVDVALREKAERDFGAWGFCSPVVAVALLVCLDLESVGDHIAVGDHYSFLFARQLMFDEIWEVLTGKPEVPLE
jgi:hypothetical protein